MLIGLVCNNEIFWVERTIVLSRLSLRLYTFSSFPIRLINILHTCPNIVIIFLSFLLSPRLWLFLLRISTQSQFAHSRSIDPQRSLRFWFIIVFFVTCQGLVYWDRDTCTGYFARVPSARGPVYARHPPSSRCISQTTSGPDGSECRGIAIPCRRASRISSGISRHAIFASVSGLEASDIVLPLRETKHDNHARFVNREKRDYGWPLTKYQCVDNQLRKCSLTHRPSSS